MGRSRKIVEEGLEILDSHINVYGLYKIYVPEYDFMSKIKPNVLTDHILKDEPSKLIFVSYMLSRVKKLRSILDTLADKETLDIATFYDCIDMDKHPYKEQFKFKPDYRIRWYDFVDKEEAQIVVKFILEAMFYIEEQVTLFLHTQKFKKYV